MIRHDRNRMPGVEMMARARVSRENVTAEAIRNSPKRKNISIFPIARPLLTGPDAITTVILVMMVGVAMESKMDVIYLVMILAGAANTLKAKNV